MTKIAVLYGSMGGNTRGAGEQIANLLGDGADALDVANADGSAFSEPDVLILGTSTWGLGDLQDDWVGALDRLKAAPLSGKYVAVFGLGDQEGYPDSFVDGMRDLYDAAVEAGATMIGACPTEGFNFTGSRAVVDGKFVGLVLDEDNQSDLTPSRIEQWVQQLRQELSAGS
jgi:flavodoxin I